MSELLQERRPSEWKAWLMDHPEASDEAKVVCHFLQFLLDGDDGLMGGLTPEDADQDAIFYAEGVKEAGVQPLLIERAANDDQAGFLAAVKTAMGRGAEDRAWLMIAFDDQAEPEKWEGRASRGLRRDIRQAVRALEPPFARIFAIGLSGRRYRAM